MNAAVLETTTPAGRVYLPAERWRVLLKALQQATRAPADQVQALRALVDFVDAIPAAIASGGRYISCSQHFPISCAWPPAGTG
jgi:hypothetical protein